VWADGGAAAGMAAANSGGLGAWGNSRGRTNLATCDSISFR
jgi:hypothetical protein